MKTIGLLPASGKASRINGLPKFALPCDEDNTSLIERQVQQMSFYVDRIVISTTSKWYELIKSFDLNKVDIVGFFMQKGKLLKEELGLIVVKDHNSFVAVKKNKIQQSLQLIQHEKIKGKKLIILEAK